MYGYALNKTHTQCQYRSVQWYKLTFGALAHLGK